MPTTPGMAAPSTPVTGHLGPLEVDGAGNVREVEATTELEHEEGDAGLRGGEAQRAKMKKAIELPSQKEVEEQMRTRIPYRTWCPHCVKARKRNVAHRKIEVSRDGVPSVAMDDCFLAAVEDPGPATTLVVRDLTTKVMGACVM